MNTRDRLSRYGSVAATAVVGCFMDPETNADTIVHEVGLTFGGDWATDEDSPALSRFDSFGLLVMETLDARMLFRGEGLRVTIPDGRAIAARWGLGSGTRYDNGTIKGPGEKGRLQVALTKMKTGPGTSSLSMHVRGFDAGEDVDSMATFLPGGFAGSRSFVSDPVGSDSIQRGLGDGRHVIGFRVVEDWEAETLAWNYGWVELSLDFEAGTLTVHRWACETDINTAASVPAGPVVPGPAGIAALSLGAAGIRVRRRRFA